MPCLLSLLFSLCALLSLAGRPISFVPTVVLQLVDDVLDFVVVVTHVTRNTFQKIMLESPCLRTAGNFSSSLVDTKDSLEIDLQQKSIKLLLRWD